MALGSVVRGLHPETPRGPPRIAVERRPALRRVRGWARVSEGFSSTSYRRLICRRAFSGAARRRGRETDQAVSVRASYCVDWTYAGASTRRRCVDGASFSPQITSPVSPANSSIISRNRSA